VSVNGNEKIASSGFVRHLRQVFDVDMQESRLVILKGLLRRCLAFDLGLQAFQIGDPMTAQATI